MKRFLGYGLIFLALYVPFRMARFSFDISTYVLATAYMLACGIYREAIR